MLPLRSVGDSFLWDSCYCLPFLGAGRPLHWNVENEGGFYVEIVWGRVQVTLDTCKGSGDLAKRLSWGHLQGYTRLWAKLPPEGSHPASHVLLKASSPILVLIAYRILGTPQPEGSGSTTSEQHREDRKDTAHLGYQQVDYRCAPRVFIQICFLS